MDDLAALASGRLVENVMVRPIRFRWFALAAALALLAFPGVARSQCVITGGSSLCNGPIELCGPEGVYEYMWIDPAGQFIFTRCITAATPGDYMLRITDEFGQTFGPCVKTVGNTPPPPCAITGPTTGCEGSAVELCGPEGEFRYTWTGPNGFTSTERGPQVSVSGTYRLSVWRTSDNCPEAMCEHTVTFSACEPPPQPEPIPPPEIENCPRAAWFWLKQCYSSERSAHRLDPQEFAAIASAVDDAAGIFNWSNDRDGFCATLHGRPLSLRTCAKRQFATVHANVCAGLIGVSQVGEREIKLDPSTLLGMRDASTTVAEWLAATDARLAQLDLVSRIGRAERDEYRRIITVGWLINHGRFIGKTCNRRAIDWDRAEIAALAPGFVDDPEDPLAEQLALEAEMAPSRAIATPNPFSNVTTIDFVVSGTTAQETMIAVYDLAGRKVRVLLRGPQSPGTLQVRWDGRGDDGAPVRSGVYMVRGLIGSQRIGGQVTVLR
jgi:hypothetical protein